jgi:hypothetical protein
MLMERTAGGAAGMMEALVCHPLGKLPQEDPGNPINTNNATKIPLKYECNFLAERAHQEQRSGDS